MSDSDSSEASDEPNNIYNDYVTLGKSSDFETVIWRFPNTDHCPLKDCMLTCSSRKNCLAHFHMHHAEICMVCTICDELFLAVNPLHLLRHYQIQHPNERPPKLKEIEDSKATCKKAENKSKDFVRHYQRIHANEKVPYDFNKSEKSQSVQTRTSARPKIENLSNDRDEDDEFITLYACGITTKWRYPKNQTDCIVFNCHQKFTSQAEGIAHYTKYHALGSLLCTICDRPIRSSQSSSDFRKHYAHCHPNETIPYDFGIGHNRQKSGTVQVKQECHDENDLIQLKFGEWRFPETTCCPVIGCRIQFGNRLDALLHYKQQHAMNAALCHLCNKPIRTDLSNALTKHFRKLHPNQNVPYGLGQRRNQSIIQTHHAKEYSRDDYADDDCDDEILLSACGRITKFKFPKHSKQCPVANCRLKFEKRSDCIAHYRHLHAKGSILCPACDKPIRIQSPIHVQVHYERRHPDEPIPYGFDTDRVTTNGQNRSGALRNDNDLITLTAGRRVTYWRFPTKNWKDCPARLCHLKFTSREHAITHFKAEHSNDSICCKLCDKPIAGQCLNLFRKHYKRIHPGVEFPIRIGLDGDVSQVTRSIAPLHQIKEEIQDADEDDDLITLTTCGITTQYKYPLNCNECPVRNCRQKFRYRSAAIKHYKKLHASGSICCPVCELPIRSPDELQVFHKHFKRMHPHMKVPYETDVTGFFPGKQEKHQTRETVEDDDDDIIILNGMGQRVEWSFPKKFKRCPVKSCSERTSNRAALKAHYKETHAEHAILCEICNIPIAILNRNNLYNLRQHYSSKHPNVDVPFIGCSAQNERILQLKMECDSRVVCDLCNVRIQPENMDQHLNEVHRTHRIYCPLKRCSYVAKQMNEMRSHWIREHKGMEFPEFRDETNFTYVVDTSKHNDDHDDIPKNVNVRTKPAQPTKIALNGHGQGSSKSTTLQRPPVNVSSDDESSVMEDNPSKQVRRSNKRKKSSDSSAWFTGIETSSDGYVNGEPIAKKHKESATYSKTRQISRSSSCSSISSSSSDCCSENVMNKLRKVARKRMSNYSDNSVHGTNPTKPTADNFISLDAIKECSVVLEQLDSSQVSNLATSSTSTESLDSLVKSECSTLKSSNDVFYVADSDEEMAPFSNGLKSAPTSKSSSIHVRRMSVLMMTKNTNDD